RNALDDEPDQAENRDPCRELVGLRHGATSINRERDEDYESERQRIHVQQVLIAAHEIVLGEEPGEDERSACRSCDQTPESRQRGRAEHCEAGPAFRTSYEYD